MRSSFGFENFKKNAGWRKIRQRARTREGRTANNKQQREQQRNFVP